jgi:hypothetical protein
VCRVGFEERSKGAAREIIANQQYRRIYLEVCRTWLFVLLSFPQVGHYPRTRAQINNNNKGLILSVFPSGFLP